MKMPARSWQTRIINGPRRRSSSTFTSSLSSERSVGGRSGYRSRRPTFDSNARCSQVLLELTRQVDQERTVLSFNVSQLGAEGKMRSFDLSVTAYLRRVAVDYCDVPGEPTPLAPRSASDSITVSLWFKRIHFSLLLLSLTVRSSYFIWWKNIQVQ